MDDNNKWKPRIGVRYWWISSIGYVYASTYTNSDKDEILIAVGNCFKTFEEAQEKADRFITILNEK